jgi:hypothetical protein
MAARLQENNIWHRHDLACEPLVQIIMALVFMDGPNLCHAGIGMVDFVMFLHGMCIGRD